MDAHDSSLERMSHANAGHQCRKVLQGCAKEEGAFLNYVVYYNYNANEDSYVYIVLV